MWIQTYSGKKFDFLNPTEASFDLQDIAHSLSCLCRFNGHTQRFYSVAEHCVVMSGLVSPEAAQGALMHDAAEAYIGDISTPLKNQAPKLCDLETDILTAICARFNINYATTRGEIKHADLRMLETERLQLMKTQSIENWECTRGIEPYNVGLPCWSPYEACSLFLQRAEMLGIQ